MIISHNIGVAKKWSDDIKDRLKQAISKSIPVKKKTGYKVLCGSLDDDTYYSALMFGAASATYHPRKITRALKFIDLSKSGNNYIRLPLLVFTNLKSAIKFIVAAGSLNSEHRSSMKVWKICYIPGKPFMPTSNKVLLCGYGKYYLDNQPCFENPFPSGTDFATCLKLIKPIKISHRSLLKMALEVKHDDQK